MQTNILIDGELVAGQGAAVDVIDPASGDNVARVNQVTDEQVDAAVRGSSAAGEYHVMMVHG